MDLIASGRSTLTFYSELNLLFNYQVIKFNFLNTRLAQGDLYEICPFYYTSLHFSIC